MSQGDRLPTNVIPVNYDICLYDLDFQEPWSFHGKVRIDLEVKSSTDSIVLSANALKIHDAKVTTGSGPSIETTGISLDTKLERCTISLAQKLDPSTHSQVSVTIDFQGTMDDSPRGFFRSRYKSAHSATELSDETRYMLATEFEPTGTRMAFPCFDEPLFKATFDFAIEIPNNLVALGNMPILNVGPHKTEKSGHQMVNFERTPRMSTYLLCWTVGDFAYVERILPRKSGTPLPVRLYAFPGQEKELEFAMDVGVHALEYYAECFKSEFPLPKLDMVVVTNMLGAMENWGLVTFQPKCILVDQATAGPKHLRLVAYVVSHEIAHQWFGNLVTMKWWDELWLNEGFATWAGWFAVDHKFPDWKVWEDSVGLVMQDAFGLDSLHCTHPVHVEVKNDLEAESVFDAISYKKGSCLIRMLAAYLGEDVFMDGVGNYLQANAYGSATANDLWNALEAVSGQKLSSFATSWILSEGFPVVSVDDSKAEILKIEQQRFSDGADAASKAPTWWIPLTPRSLGEGTERGTPMKTSPFTEHKSELDQSNGKILTINTDNAGFYRTSWSRKHLNTFVNSLDQLSTSEKVGSIFDLAALATIHHDGHRASEVLWYLRHFRTQTNNNVWKAIGDSLKYIQASFSADEKIAAGLRQYVIDITSAPLALLERHFFEEHKASDPPGAVALNSKVREILLTLAGLAGRQDVVEQAKSRVQRHLSGDETALSSVFSEGALSIAVKYSSPELITQIKTAANRTTSAERRWTYLQCLGQTSNESSMRDLLKWAFSGEIEVSALSKIPEGLAANPNVHLRNAMWEFVRDEWDSTVWPCIGKSKLAVEHNVARILGCLTDKTRLEEVKKFFYDGDKDLMGYRRGVAIGIENIELTAQYVSTDQEDLRKYLTENGYIKA